MIASRQDIIEYNSEREPQYDNTAEYGYDYIEQPQQESEEQTLPKINIKPDRGFNYLMSQIAVCAIALLIVLALKMLGGYYYAYSRAVFDECFNQPINKAQVLGRSDACAVVAAQSTVYGMGGESADDTVKHVTSIDELSQTDSKRIKAVNSMILPVDSRTVTCEYGNRIHPITGNKSFHTGIDIGEDMGKNIYAVLDGKVKKTVHDDPDYGNYIIITHSQGVETMYAHCKSLNVKKGDSVRRGDVIAYVGTTGLSTGPHLHFEVRINGTRLNPRWFIKI